MPVVQCRLGELAQNDVTQRFKDVFVDVYGRCRACLRLEPCTSRVSDSVGLSGDTRRAFVDISKPFPRFLNSLVPGKHSHAVSSRQIVSKAQFTEGISLRSFVELASVPDSTFAIAPIP